MCSGLLIVTIILSGGVKEGLEKNPDVARDTFCEHKTPATITMFEPHLDTAFEVRT